MIDVSKVGRRRWVYLEKSLGPVKLFAYYHGTLKDAAASVVVGSVMVRLGNNAGGDTFLDVSLRVLRL